MYRREETFEEINLQHEVTRQAALKLGCNTLEATHDKVIILRDKAPELSEGGIALAHTFEKPNWCTVVAVPKTVRVDGKDVKPSIEPGDRVFISPSDTKPLDGIPYQNGVGPEGESQPNDYEYTPYYCIESRGEDFNALESKVIVRLIREDKHKDIVRDDGSECKLVLIHNHDLLTRWREDSGKGEVISSKVPDINVGDVILYHTGEGAFLSDDCLSIHSSFIHGVLENVSQN